MRSDDNRPPEVKEFHDAWRTQDVPALIDLIFRTPTGWTIIAFVLTVCALLLALAGVFNDRPMRAEIVPSAPEIDLRRDGCISCDVRPATSPQSWVVTDDYPPSAQRAGEEGITTVMMTIGRNGRVIGCTVTQQSGSAALDRAACASLTARARYYPATDANGAAIETSVTRRVRWQLPPE